MRINNKLYLSILMVVFGILMVIGFASAVIEELPDYVKVGDCVNLVQQDNVSVQVLQSVLKPNGIDYINVTMQKRGNFFNYTYCNNTVSGGYTVNGYDNTGITWAYQYYVNAQGKEYTSTDGMVYIALLLLLIGLFIFGFYNFLTIDYQDVRNDEGELIKINYKKYLKQFSFLMTYTLFIGIMFVAWNISYGIIEFQTLANIFYWLFRLSFVMGMAIYPFLLIYLFIKYIQDLKLQDMVNKGLTVE